MGTIYGRHQRDHHLMIEETREDLRVLTRHATGSGSEQQAIVALERYLQTPTFRRQGRRLSCR